MQLMSCAAHAFTQTPRGGRQALGSLHHIGRADVWGTFRMGLPCCSEQWGGNRAPQLGAGGPFGVGEWHTLSDKELQAMVANCRKMS